MRRKAMGSGSRPGSDGRATLAAVVLLLAGAYGPPATRAFAQACATAAGIERVSVNSEGDEGDGASLLPTINEDGCVVAFKSSASNLVTDDRNGWVDVFVRDRTGAGVTERVSLAIVPGKESDGNSFPPSLNADGRIVAFASLASNLVRGDFNTSPDLFVYDRVGKMMSILTLVLDLNGDGRGGGEVPDLPPSVSADGNFVAFSSMAGDLVPSLDTNETSDVFVYDRAAGGPPQLMSIITAGGQQGRAANGPSAGAAISADGCIVVFYSDASNLV